MSEQLAQRVEVVNRNGLHARPASLLVELAKGFQSEISIVTDGHEVDGKSILEVLSLAAARGTMLEVRAEGSDAAKALAAIEELFASGFDHA